MSCTGCGTDERLIKLLVNEAIREAIDNHKIQEAIKDCDGSYLHKDMQVAQCHQVDAKDQNLKDELAEKIENVESDLNDKINAIEKPIHLLDQNGKALIENDKVVKADDLASVICQMLEDGELCIQSVTGFTLRPNDNDDIILTLHTTSENYPVNLSEFFKDTYVNKAGIEDNTLRLVKNDGVVVAEVDLSKYDQKEALVNAVLDNKIIKFPKFDGKEISVDLSSITKTDAEVAAVFNTCAGTPHNAGNAVPTCEEMRNAIAEAIRRLPADKFANSFVREGNTIKLTLTDDTEMKIDVSDLVPVKTGTGLTGNGTEASPIQLNLTNAPASATVSYAEDGEIATTYYGGHGKIMGAPATWMELVPGYLIPVYRKA